MNGHIDIRTLSRYFLNMLSPEEETAVQEHLHICRECSAKLEAMRKLRDGIFDGNTQKKENGTLFRIIRSGWTKAAAAVIVAACISVVSIQTARNRSDIAEQHTIIQNNTDESVLDIDTFDRQDSLYYREKYGEDFKF